MRITDQGIKIVLDSKEPRFHEELNSYLIYEWKGLEYFASLTEPKNLSTHQIFIEVSEEQFQSLSTLANSQNSQPNASQVIKSSEAEPDQKPEPSISTVRTSNLSILSQITSEYESALLLRLDLEEKSLVLEDFCGENKPKKDFNISLKQLSPFKIVHDTGKPFHGIYAETPTFNQNLSKCGVNPENLWVTAYPLVKKGMLLGMLVGLSNNRDYSLSELDIFEKLNNFATEVLTLKEADNNNEKKAA